MLLGGKKRVLLLLLGTYWIQRNNYKKWVLFGDGVGIS